MERRRRGSGWNRGNALWPERAQRYRRRQAQDRGVALEPAAGAEIVTGYDRSGLIRESISTLGHDLVEEAIIVSLVIVIFLFHFRSALIPILILPLAVLASF